ncbi:PAS domain S-box protein, partial [candidate division KSB1 bacterium]
MDNRHLENRIKKLEQENKRLKKLDQKLRESEEKYRAAIEQSLENIVILDIESKKIIEANRAFRKFLGYNAGEIKKLSIYDFVAHSKKDINQKINNAIEKEKLFIGERKYRKKDRTLV